MSSMTAETRGRPRIHADEEILAAALRAFAVQGYDAAQMLGVGLKAAGGDIAKKAEFRQAIEKATIPSPRGDFTISKSHNPVQDMYLRKVVGKENQRMGVAIKALGDTGRGCRM